MVFTIGKYSVVDIFDTNKYAHDPRNDFFNWSIIDGGTFDYAANAWGETYGAAVEWYQDWWTARVGLFDLSVAPNSEYLDNRFISQAQFVAELEERHTLWDQPGKLKVLYWLIRGNLGALPRLKCSRAPTCCLT
jgi:high affinity Mn2+ porin